MNTGLTKMKIDSGYFFCMIFEANSKKTLRLLISL